jgi:hypothetical protein
MEGTKNINKKLLIAIFTAPFLIGSIYSVYSQATSAQNNAAISSLESNSIIQWIINSSISGYSTAGQSLASFLSINGIPSYVWTIITFLMATLFFIAIYIFLFEIFIQRAKISENETMRKAKILFIFTLSIFSAIAIGYAIPFLLNLYGLILLILLLIALFFFGRATISYGKSFHYATKSLAVNVEKDLVNLEKELKEAKKYIPQEYAKSLTEGIEKIRSIYDEAENAHEAADKKFQNILSNIIKEYENFINNLIKDYEKYLNENGKKLNDAQVKKLEELINYLKNERNNIDKSKVENISESIRRIHDEVLKYNENIASFSPDDKAKVELRNKLNNILNKVYNDTLLKYKQISLEIENVIDEYMKARTKLNTLYSYEKGLNDIGLRVRKSLGIHGNRKAEIGMLSALKELRNDIEKTRSSINERIQFLENLKNRLP